MAYQSALLSRAKEKQVIGRRLVDKHFWRARDIEARERTRSIAAQKRAQLETATGERECAEECRRPGPCVSSGLACDRQKLAALASFDLV